MTAGPLLLERITKQFWTDYEAWSRQFITPAHRRTIGIGMAVFGIFAAGFLAFDDERAKLEKANATIASVRSPSYIPYDPIDKSSYDKLSSNFAQFAGQTTFVSFDVTDRSSTEVSTLLEAALEAAKLVSSQVSGWRETDSDTGIQLVIRNHEHPSVEDQKYVVAMEESGIPFHTVEMPKTSGYTPFRFAIFVGPNRVVFR